MNTICQHNAHSPAMRLLFGMAEPFRLSEAMGSKIANRLKCLMKLKVAISFFSFRVLHIVQIEV